MQSATAKNLGPRIILSAVLIAALIAVVGCTAVPKLPSFAPETPAATPTTVAGYVYEDDAAAYAVTFPGEPFVEQLAIYGTDRFANLVGYGDPSTMFYISRGEIREFPVNLRNELFGWLGSVSLSGQIGANSDELDGLPALRAEFTTQGGEESTTIVASEGNRFYQLIVSGGTPEERQAFFDSFEFRG
jgi:hypothetical protein